MSTCAEVAQRLNYWPPNLTDEGSSPGVSFSFFFFFFFFFFFNIHTSDKLEIFFDHSILVNGVDPWGVHRFLGGINHENGIYSMGQRHECGLAQRLNYWPPNLTDEGSSPGVSFSFFLFFFFFFNIHTSDKLEINEYNYYEGVGVKPRLNDQTFLSNIMLEEHV